MQYLSLSRLFILLIVTLFLSPFNFADNSINSQNPSYQYYGPIASHDDLWQIAKQYRPNSSISVEKMAVAIYQLNKRVFLQHNINGLMKGYFLQIPNLEQIQKISEQQAITSITQQNQQWQQYLQADKNSKAEALDKPQSSSSTSIINIEGLAKPEITITKTLETQELKGQTNSPKTIVTLPMKEQNQSAIDEQVLKVNLLALTQENSDLAQELEQQNKRLEQEATFMALDPHEKQNDPDDQNNAAVSASSRDSSSMTKETTSFSNLKAYLNHSSSPTSTSMIQSMEKYLIFVFAIVLVIIIIVIFFAMRACKRKRILRSISEAQASSAEAIEECSGDSVYETQLDLAMAYIKLKRYHEAIPLLESVIATGEPEQVTHAQNLLDSISQYNDEQQ